MKSPWSRWRRVGLRVDAAGTPEPGDGSAPLEVAEDDPLLLHLQRHPETVAVSELELDSPALDAMRAAGVVRGRAAGRRRAS